jgi:anti-sigma factor RsiW
MTQPAAAKGSECEQVIGMLSDYLDDEISAPDRRVVALHLGRCVGCARLAAELAATVRALHRLGEAAEPARRPGGGTRV